MQSTQQFIICDKFTNITSFVHIRKRWTPATVH